MNRRVFIMGSPHTSNITKTVNCQGLYCLPLVQHFLDTTLGSKLYFVQILEQVWYGVEVSEYLSIYGMFLNALASAVFKIS